jgi:uncharacterized protein YdhG (YjbR/CyaY superfamily)
VSKARTTRAGRTNTAPKRPAKKAKAKTPAKKRASAAQTILCATHRERIAAVVCGHLVGEAETARGFVENSSEPEDLQAWCDACERMYLREDGRTEAFRAFHDMQVVCDLCYARIRERHAAPAAGPPRTIDAYLATLTPERRAPLQRLRETIKKLLPAAEECISYAMPAFRLGGHVVAGFQATAKGCSYYPFSGTTLRTLGAELAAYDQTKSALHFDPKRPLPASLVRRLLSTRIAETKARAAARR